MSVTLNTTINYILQELAIYYGIPVFFFGLIGALLNILVFLTSGLARQKACVFYLTLLSTFDLGRLWSNTLVHILKYGFDIELHLIIPYFCKIRVFILTVCMLGSMTCLCLAVFDQFCATSSSPFWQQFSNIKLADNLIKFFSILYFLHGLPYLTYFDNIISPSTNQTICQITNKQFIKYHTYGYFLCWNNIIPFLTVTFGLLAYRNTRRLSKNGRILFRENLDRQLTNMILAYVFVYFLTFLPYAIQSIYALIIFDRNEPLFRAKVQFRSIITMFISILSFSSSFYVYLLISKYFRQHLQFILCNFNQQRHSSVRLALENRTTKQLQTNNIDGL